MALSNLTKVQTVGIGSNIEVVGVITTGQFKSGTSNLHSTGVELTNLNVSGIATIGGNLSIGGTLTYQDVTNIDSVGLITARSGINVSGGTATFAGDVSIADKIIHTGDTNTTIRFPSADTITFETAGSERLRIASDGVATFAATNINVNRNAGDAFISLQTSGTSNVALYGGASSGFRVFTKPSGGSLTERLRIDSTGITTITSTSNEELFRIQTSFGNGGGVQGKALMGFDHFSVSEKPAILIGSEEVGTSSHMGNFVIKLKDAAATDDDPVERLRITSSGNVLIGTTSGSEILCIKRDDATGPSITLENDSNKAYINNWGSSGGGSGRTNRFEINATSQAQASYCAPYHTFMTGGTGDSNEKLRIHSSGTLQAYNHATSRNGIVQINQVTSTTRYSGSIASVDLITGSTFTPKTSAPRFLIMIFCPVNTSDDSDAGSGNRNDYFYGRIEYRKSGGGWIECDNQGSTSNQGGYAAHIELSPNRTGADTTGGGYWSGNRYRMEHKQATVLVTNVGDCGSSGTVQFKLRGYSHSGSFVHIGQPHGYGTDDNYAVQPWGFTVFELAPDNNSYTAY